MSGFVSREDKLSNELGFDSGSDDDRSGPIDARRGTSSAAKAPAPPPLGIARAVAGSGFGDVSKQHAASHIVEGGSIGSVDGKTLSELERTIGDLIEQKASLEMRLKSSDDAKNNAETRLALYRRSIQGVAKKRLDAVNAAIKQLQSNPSFKPLVDELQASVATSEDFEQTEKKAAKLARVADTSGFVEAAAAKSPEHGEIASLKEQLATANHLLLRAAGEVACLKEVFKFAELATTIANANKMASPKSLMSVHDAAGGSNEANGSGGLGKGLQGTFVMLRSAVQAAKAVVSQHHHQQHQQATGAGAHNGATPSFVDPSALSAAATSAGRAAGTEAMAGAASRFAAMAVEDDRSSVSSSTSSATAAGAMPAIPPTPPGAGGNAAAASAEALQWKRKFDETARQLQESVRTSQETKLKMDASRQEIERLQRELEIARLSSASAGAVAASAAVAAAGISGDAAAAALAREQAKAAQLTVDYTRLQSELASVTDELQRTAAEAKSLKEERDMLQKTLAGERSKNQELLAAASAQGGQAQQVLQQQITGLNTKVVALEASVSSLTSKSNLLQSQLDGKEKELAELKASSAAKIAALEAEVQKASSSSAAAAQQSADNNKRLTEAQDKVNQLTKALDETKAAATTKETKMQQQHQQALEQLKMSSSAELAQAQQQALLLKQQSEAQIANLKQGLSRVAPTVQAAAKAKDEVRALQQLLRQQAVAMQGEMSGAFLGMSREFSARLASQSAAVADLVTRLKKEMTERKRLHNMVQELRGNIRVFCRVRPALPFELDKGDALSVSFPDPGEITVINNKRQVKTWEFDQVFIPTITNEQVFRETEPFVVSVLDGYNVCIFAYGQTGSGKTFTMEGTESSRGVNYRALETLFALRDERKSDARYEVAVSLLEIYNENIHCLLTPRMGSDGPTRIAVREGPQGVFVPDLTIKPVESLDDVLKIMKMGYKNRTSFATNMNEHSSRSHCMLSVYVSGTNRVTGVTARGKLHLVDLAGSERVSKSGVTGDRLKEAQNINKSLSALGDVIQARMEKRGHVPFRNSTLTWLLSDSLSGDSKTLMFVNLSPILSNAEETVCSLNFASRARNVEMGKATKHVSAGSGSGRSGGALNNGEDGDDGGAGGGGGDEWLGGEGEDGGFAGGDGASGGGPAAGSAATPTASAGGIAAGRMSMAGAGRPSVGGAAAAGRAPAAAAAAGAASGVRRPAAGASAPGVSSGLRR